MEKISEMIERMCPEGVERVKLIGCSNILYGYPFESDLFTEDKSYIPLIRIRDIMTGKSSTYYCGDILSDYIIKKGDILVGMDGNFNLAKWNDRDGLLNQRVLKLSSIDGLSANGYLYHLLGPIFKSIELNTAGGSVKHLSAKIINNIKIPLPPLPIQQEIVRVLDTFTQLQSNLEAELAARQKQYEYYRNKLLTFDKNDESVEWKTLGEIGTIYKGKGIQKADFTDVGKPCIHYGQVHTFYGSSATETKSFISEELYSSSNKAIFGDIIIATTSEDVEACCKSTVWLGDGEPAISGDAHYYRHNQNPKYMGYLFMTEMFAVQKRIAAVGAKVTRVHGDSIMKFKFPFPSLQRQQEIVSILDTFESLITNLKQEIEARKKQYEYYREQLLTF